MASTELTDYERQRLENVRRNEEMMAALKVRSKATELSATAKRPRFASKSYAEKKPKTETTPVVIRRSLRTRGKPPPKNGDDDDVVVDDSAVETVKKKPSVRDLGPISMEDVYQGDGSAKMLFEAFRGNWNKTTLGVESGGEIDGNGNFMTCNDDVGDGETGNTNGDRLKLENMILKPENVARVVPGRIMAVKFFPWAEKRMIVTGNKFGNIGFWDVDSGEEENNGIYLYRPHSGPISGIIIPRCSSSKMFTSCYDGFIKMMDAERGVFDMLYSTDDTIYSLSQRPDDMKCLYFGEGQGGLNIWDERSRKSVTQWSLHDSRINTIDFNMQNPHIMSTSSSDGTACIWDLRSVNAEKPMNLATVNHKRAVHSAYFSPSGKRLATTSMDDTIGILGGTNFEHSSMIPHDNKTGRWISPFRAIWGWDDSYIFVGNMKRPVDVISPGRRKMVWTLKSPEVSAIPCRFDIHPYNVGTLAAATSGGQIYMWTLK